MNIIRLMIPKINVAYVNSHDTVRQGLEKLRIHGYTAVPVISQDGSYAGTLTEGDLLWAIVENGKADLKSLEGRRINSVINPGRNPAVRIDATEDELFAQAAEQNFVPVCDDRGVFIGIVTRSAILNYFRDIYIKS